jgi:hypothetical protein
MAEFNENTGSPEEREYAKNSFELLLYSFITKTELLLESAAKDSIGLTGEALHYTKIAFEKFKVSMVAALVVLGFR